MSKNYLLYEIEIFHSIIPSTKDIVNHMLLKFEIGGFLSSKLIVDRHGMSSVIFLKSMKQPRIIYLRYETYLKEKPAFQYSDI